MSDPTEDRALTFLAAAVGLWGGAIYGHFGYALVAFILKSLGMAAVLACAVRANRELRRSEAELEPRRQHFLDGDTE